MLNFYYLDPEGYKNARFSITNLNGMTYRDDLKFDITNLNGITNRDDLKFDITNLNGITK